MGRSYKSNRNKFTKKRRERETEKNEGSQSIRSESYQNIIKENEKFVRYYKQNRICQEIEWSQFIETLKLDLPTTFRISGCRSTKEKLLNIIQNEFFDEQNINIDDPSIRPSPLVWYPKNLAWQIGLSRKSIRRLESHYKLHNFLIAETKVGSISRQEAVSMIPPIVLDVQSHHKVLDTCAAPGSKTAQLIESLHSGMDGFIDLPSGFVIANDIDNNRCYMLVHQAKRLNSPNLVVINEDSSCMPRFKARDNSDLKFDRILCDVPCSGDGTMRKNPDIWKKWHPGNAMNLHGVQYRIVRRGVELLEIGGRLVYSTCSLNPIENEAVLHRLLKESDGALELVDISHHVPGLKYVAGLTYWEPTDKECQNFYKSYEEVPETLHNVIRPQMFPPTQEEAHNFSLSKCMRILPHFQNTGGFFVAALHKKRLLPWEKKETSENDKPSELDQIVRPPQMKKRRFFGHREDPFVFFNGSEEVWMCIKSFYDINDSFDPSQLLTRSQIGKKKNIYFCTNEVKNFVQANEECVKIINTGVKVFSRCDYKNMKCEFRLVNDGLFSLKSVIGSRRRICVNKIDLISILESTDPKNAPDISNMSENVQKQMVTLDAGSCIIYFMDTSGIEFCLVGWKGSHSIRAYIDINESIHLLRLLGANISKFEVNKFSLKCSEKQDKNIE